MYKPNKIKRYNIGERGEFNTLAQAISWLGSNMKGQTELFLDSGNFDISDTIAINLPYHLHIKGFDFLSTIIRATTGLTNKPMIQITSSVFMDNITLDGSNLASYGTLISPLTVRCAVSGQSYSYGLIAFLENVTENDYIEIFVTSTTNGDLATLQDLTIYAESK